MLFSIVIPALDEAGTIGATLASTHDARKSREVIVVDGGSRDATACVAEAAGARVIRSPRRQRAAQMNLGAEAARGGILLFLHADTRLAPGALHAVIAALRDPRVVGGAFARRYDSPSLLLRATCALARWRNRLWGWHLGDQAMFVRAEMFRRLGGFADADQFEDLDFSRRLGRCGKLVTITPPVISSARRFEVGAGQRTFGDVRLTLRYLRLGIGGGRPICTGGQGGGNLGPGEARNVPPAVLQTQVIAPIPRAADFPLDSEQSRLFTGAPCSGADFVREAR